MHTIIPGHRHSITCMPCDFLLQLLGLRFPILSRVSFEALYACHMYCNPQAIADA